MNAESAEHPVSVEAVDEVVVSPDAVRRMPRLVERRPGRTLIGLALLFIAARLPLLLWSPLAVYDDEELYNGTVARELLAGHSLALRDCLYYPHEGGSLVMSLLTVPCFAVFGTNFIALKLSALGVSLATFLIWVRVVDGYCGRASACFLAAFFIAAPPLLLKSDLMTWGHHNNIGLVIAIACALLLAETGSSFPPRNNRRLIALGAVCGFGLFFAYIFLPMLLTCIVRLAVTRRARRRWSLFLLGLAAGFTPWVAVNLLTDFAGLDVFHRHDDAPGSAVDLVAKLTELITVVIPRAAGFRDVAGVRGQVLSMVYAVLLLAAAVSGSLACRGGRRSLASTSVNAGDGMRSVVLTACTFVACFLAIYAAGPFRIDLQWPASERFVDFRYLLPVFPVLLVLAACGLAGRQSDGAPILARRRLAVTTSALLVGLGLWGIVDSVRAAEYRTSASFRGYSYERLGWRAFTRYAGDPLQGRALAERIDPDQVDDFYRGVGWGVAGRWPRDDAFPLWLATLPTESRGWAWEGFGWRVADNSDGDPDQINQVGASIAAEARDAYYRGVGWITARRYRDRLSECTRLLAQIPAAHRQAAWVGAGRVWGERAAFTDTNQPRRDEFPAEYRSAADAGIRESQQRYAEGRFMDGPTYLRWGRIAFHTWEQPGLSETISQPEP